MENILDKYNFTYKKDKELLKKFLKNIKDDKIKEIVDIYLKNKTKFDSRVLYNPIELLDAIFENDLLWNKIDTDEVKDIIEKLSFFEKYYNGEINDKEFIEKKYGLKIILFEKDKKIPFYDIYGYKLNKVQQIMVLKKIEKLLSFYPITFIKNVNLANIVVSAYFYKKTDYGISVLWGFETNTDNNIYLALRWIERSFHHELYHQAMQNYNDKKEWEKIRSKQKISHFYKNVDEKIPWFARAYGQDSIEEDQATCAEEICTNYRRFIKRIEKDELLKQKANLVFKAYEIISEWKMDKNFWKKKFYI